MKDQIIPRAPAVAAKLEAACLTRAALETEVAAAALDAAEGGRHAEKRLADLRGKIATADRDVFELEKAHALALNLDKRATLAARATMRKDQLSEFTGLARARDGAVAEMMTAIEKLSAVYGRYTELTIRMAGVLPIGTALTPMALGPNGVLGPANGKLEGLICAEAFRLVDTSKPIRTALPFAKAPSLGLMDNPKAVRPGADVFREATEATLREIRTQVEQLDAADATALGVQEEAA